MAIEQEDGLERRTFRSCVVEVAQLLGIDVAAPTAEPQRARRIAAAVRTPLRERATLPEELFDPLMAAAVYEPDPSFCRWFVEPGLYVFGRRRVQATLVHYLRTGTDLERAGAARAWYWTALPLREGRSPAYLPGEQRDQALDASQDLVEAWQETSMQVFTDTPGLAMCSRLVWMLPRSPEHYAPRLRDLCAHTVEIARGSSDPRIARWSAAAMAGELAAKSAPTERTDVGSG